MKRLRRVVRMSDAEEREAGATLLAVLLLAAVLAIMSAAVVTLSLAASAAGKQSEADAQNLFNARAGILYAYENARTVASTLSPKTARIDPAALRTQLFPGAPSDAPFSLPLPVPAYGHVQKLHKHEYSASFYVISESGNVKLESVITVVTMVKLNRSGRGEQSADGKKNSDQNSKKHGRKIVVVVSAPSQPITIP